MIFDKDELILNVRNISSQMRKCNMIFSDDTLTPEADTMLEEVFELFSTDGQMDPDQAVEYVYLSTGSRCRKGEN